MPAKNAESTIRLAINSALRAMPRDSELIVWNDGSDDGTLAVVARVNDSRLVLMDSPTSVGSGAARASMIAHSDSQFVANMDADDYCFPWRFTVQKAALETSDLSFGGFVRFGTTPLRVKPSRMVNYGGEDVALSLAFHNPLLHTSMVAHRSSLEKAGGYRELRVAQDFDLWLRSVTSGLRLSVQAIPVVGYRLSPHQISNSDDYSQRVRSSEQLALEFFKLLEFLRPGAKQALMECGPADETKRIQTIRQELVSKFSTSRHRRYYSNLLQSNQVGPFGVSCG
jgi:glycosyltransferase involved in cell wall biosynthesis